MTEPFFRFICHGSHLPVEIGQRGASGIRIAEAHIVSVAHPVDLQSVRVVPFQNGLDDVEFVRPDFFKGIIQRRHPVTGIARRAGDRVQTELRVFPPEFRVEKVIILPDVVAIVHAHGERGASAAFPRLLQPDLIGIDPHVMQFFCTAYPACKMIIQPVAPEVHSLFAPVLDPVPYRVHVQTVHIGTLRHETVGHFLHLSGAVMGNQFPEFFQTCAFDATGVEIMGTIFIDHDAAHKILRMFFLFCPTI